MATLYLSHHVQGQRSPQPCPSHHFQDQAAHPVILSCRNPYLEELTASAKRPRLQVRVDMGGPEPATEMEIHPHAFIAEHTAQRLPLGKQQ